MLEQLTYVQIGDRLNISSEGARAIVKRNRLSGPLRASSAASASTLDPLSMELANELRTSKVVQLRAAIARRSFVLPKHLNLMSSDAGNRARSAGLMIVFADPDDAVAQR